MTKPEHDWWDRIGQANKRLDELDTLIKTFIATNPYGVVTKLYRKTPDAGVAITTMTVERPVPTEASLLLAEIFGHLRSSLDHLMCALCTSPEPPNGTQFPIFKDRKVFRARDPKGSPRRGSGRFQMRGAPAREQAIIQSLQPYKRGTAATSDKLWLVHRFSNIDKHHKPHLTGAILQGATMVVDGTHNMKLTISGVGAKVGAFQAGTELCRFAFSPRATNYKIWGEDGKMNVYPEIAYGVAFDPKGPGEGALVVSTVRDLILYLRTIVVPKLEPFV